MKPFFRAVIQIKYTENLEKREFPDLKEYLIEKNLIDDQFDFDGQIELFDEMIKNLIANDDSEGSKFNEICNYYGYEEERDIKELSTVWDAEKDAVFSYIVKQGTSYKKLEKIEWAVNSKVYGKKAKSIKDVACIISLKVSEHGNTNTKFLTFEANRNELQELSDELSRIEAEIASLFAPPEEAQK